MHLDDDNFDAAGIGLILLYVTYIHILKTSHVAGHWGSFATLNVKAKNK